MTWFVIHDNVYQCWMVVLLNIVYYSTSHGCCALPSAYCRLRSQGTGRTLGINQARHPCKYGLIFIIAASKNESIILVCWQEIYNGLSMIVMSNVLVYALECEWIKHCGFQLSYPLYRVCVIWKISVPREAEGAIQFMFVVLLPSTFMQDVE